tara:strand:- start:154 stop:1362 length:1209 start_codon:yes stop_codon:yes gene_type:complete
MLRKTPHYILKITSISFGFISAFVLLEIISRILPASKNFPLKLPLNCKTLITSFSDVDQDCLFQRNPNFQGIFTRGIFPPFPVYAFKKANDIGQFSDVDFHEVSELNPKIFPIISIGDSYAEALQVPNYQTYHGLLNQYITQNGKIVKSSAIASGGNPLSQYVISAMFARKYLKNPNSTFIFSIISNDFDESILGENAFQTGGIFKINKDDYGKTLYINRDSSLGIKTRRFIFKNSAFARFLMINVRITNFAYKYPFCLFTDFSCNEIKNIKANIVDSSKSNDNRRFNISYKATDTFLFEISKLRPTDSERKKTIFVIDADRFPIYDKTLKESEYFRAQRNYFIKRAKTYGFTVIDMKPIFSDHYLKNKQRFEFSNDKHWNSLGHKVVSQEIIKNLELQPKS